MALEGVLQLCGKQGSVQATECIERRIRETGTRIAIASNTSTL